MPQVGTQSLVPTFLPCVPPRKGGAMQGAMHPLFLSTTFLLLLGPVSVLPFWGKGLSQTKDKQLRSFWVDWARIAIDPSVCSCPLWGLLPI